MKSIQESNREAIDLVMAHLQVWAEADDEKRMALAQRVYAENVRVIDPEIVLNGQGEVSDFIGSLLKKSPGFKFQLTKRVETHHDMGILCWRFGLPSKPDTITGEDIITMSEGRISSVLVFVDGATK